MPAATPVMEERVCDGAVGCFARFATMKFAFLIHPLSDETNYVLHFGGGTLQNRWGTDPVGFCRAVHEAVGSYEDVLTDEIVEANRIADEMSGLVSLHAHRPMAGCTRFRSTPCASSATVSARKILHGTRRPFRSRRSQRSTNAKRPTHRRSPPTPMSTLAPLASGSDFYRPDRALRDIEEA